MDEPLVPPALVLGCNTPHGIGVLSDWIEERIGYPPDFTDTGWSDVNLSANADVNRDGYVYGDGNGYGDGNIYGRNDGDGDGVGYGYGDSDGKGHGDGDDYRYGNGFGRSDGLISSKTYFYGQPRPLTPASFRDG